MDDDNHIVFTPVTSLNIVSVEYVFLYHAPTRQLVTSVRLLANPVLTNMGFQEA